MRYFTWEESNANKQNLLPVFLFIIVYSKDFSVSCWYKSLDLSFITRYDDHIWKIFSDMSTISVNCADVNRKWDDKQHGDSGVLAGLWYQKSERFHTLCKEEIAVFLVPKIIARKETNSHSTDDNSQVRNACEDRYLVITWNCQGTGKCYEDGNVTLITSNSVSLKVEIFWMNSTCVWNEELCGS